MEQRSLEFFFKKNLLAAKQFALPYNVGAGQCAMEDILQWYADDKMQWEQTLTDHLEETFWILGKGVGALGPRRVRWPCGDC